MRVSRRFINFAGLFCIVLTALSFTACKGRTLDNVEPTGDTVRVVIMQNSVVDSSDQETAGSVTTEEGDENP